MELEIHGVTFVDNRKDEVALYRYVDWMGVATQLGLEVSWRVPVDEVQYRAVLDTLDHDPADEGQLGRTLGSAEPRAMSHHGDDLAHLDGPEDDSLGRVRVGRLADLEPVGDRARFGFGVEHDH